MIDINHAKIAFKKFLENYKNQDQIGFNLKVVHTYNVVNKAKEIATRLNLKKEDIELAELIALLHDIGRFEEITILKNFDNINFDHANYGVKILFEDNLIRNFISDNQYDEIIRVAIENHNKMTIETNLSERCLLHAKIIRDADKLDNFRLKKEEKVETIFPGKLKTKEEIENALLSDKVYDSVKNRQCVNIHDRVTVLDYWVCVLAFAFDLNFQESYEIVTENNYINELVNRFEFKDQHTSEKMENIRSIINEYVDQKTKKLKKY